MFTYQVRKRIFRLQEDQTISFPNHVSVVFYLQPLQPFGVSADGGRTAVQNIAAKAFFNANTGHHYIVSATPLKPLEVLIEEPKRIITIKGNQLHISEQFESLWNNWGQVYTLDKGLRKRYNFPSWQDH